MRCRFFERYFHSVDELFHFGVGKPIAGHVAADAIPERVEPQGGKPEPSTRLHASYKLRCDPIALKTTSEFCG